MVNESASVVSSAWMTRGYGYSAKLLGGYGADCFARAGFGNPAPQTPDVAIRREQPKNHPHFCVMLRGYRQFDNVFKIEYIWANYTIPVQPMLANVKHPQTAGLAVYYDLRKIATHNPEVAGSNPAPATAQAP